MGKIKTALTLSKRFFTDLKEFDFHVAWAKLYRDLPIGDWNTKYRHCNDTIYDYLFSHYSDLMKDVFSHETQSFPADAESFLWIMWWQGEDNMPPIVKACWKQVNFVARGIKIVLIDQYNYRDYVDLPATIEVKFSRGDITITHLSDIIRCQLLYKFGGIWVDALCWLDSLPEYIISSELYTVHAPGLFPACISNGEWASFVMATNKRGLLIYKFMNAFFNKYWEDHNVLIDYLLVDFPIRMCVDNNSYFHNLLNSIPYNDKWYDLNLHINEVYTQEYFYGFLQDSFLQKINRKQCFVDEVDGQKTIYSYLVTK